MPRSFWRATAEAVVAAVDATFVSVGAVTPENVASFSSLTLDNARSALDLATDLGLLQNLGGSYEIASPLCRALVTPNQQRKATALRVVLEDYEPFTRFRERLINKGDAATAAQQTKSLLDLDIHHDEVKETLLSLGQYCQALIAVGGGVYQAREDSGSYDLDALIQGCISDIETESLVREQLGATAYGIVSRDNVVRPLTIALQHAKSGDGRSAVVNAGNAVESYLGELAIRVGVNLQGKSGINAKAEHIAQNSQVIVLPKKLQNISKYLGHIRNAADHGTDSEIGTAWLIRRATGVEYCFVACSFICATTGRENNGPPEL